tara:strand:+ start:2599 stop:2865 length:267 start_codon:yes stop_codon:yes gene_type:complete
MTYTANGIAPSEIIKVSLTLSSSAVLYHSAITQRLKVTGHLQHEWAQEAVGEWEWSEYDRRHVRVLYNSDGEFDAVLGEIKVPSCFQY